MVLLARAAVAAEGVGVTPAWGKASRHPQLQPLGSPALSHLGYRSASHHPQSAESWEQPDQAPSHPNGGAEWASMYIHAQGCHHCTSSSLFVAGPQFQQAPRLFPQPLCAVRNKVAVTYVHSTLSATSIFFNSEVSLHAQHRTNCRDTKINKRRTQ